MNVAVELSLLIAVFVVAISAFGALVFVGAAELSLLLSRTLKRYIK